MQATLQPFDMKTRGGEKGGEGLRGVVESRKVRERETTEEEEEKLQESTNE